MNTRHLFSGYSIRKYILSVNLVPEIFRGRIYLPGRSDLGSIPGIQLLNPTLKAIYARDLTRYASGWTPSSTRVCPAPHYNANLGLETFKGGWEDDERK